MPDNDRDASISDAAFREALEDYAQERMSQVTCGGPKCDNAHKILVADARARVLALYAERLGEEYEVVSIYSDDDEYRRDVVDVTAKLSRGDKVRVTKVEEGR